MILENYNEIYLCSVNETIKNLESKGYAKPKNLYIIYTINELLKNLEYSITTKEINHLNSLGAIIANTASEVCLEDLEVNYYTSVDDCLNPTYESSRNINRGPNVDDNEIII